MTPEEQAELLKQLTKLTKAELAESQAEMIAKVNSLEKLLTEERAQAKRTSIVAKICALNPDFKDDAKFSDDFLTGVEFAYAHPTKTVKGDPKVNAGSAPPAGGSEKLLFTPNGYVESSKIPAGHIATREDIEKKVSDI